MSQGLFSLWCSSSGSRSEAIVVANLVLDSWGGSLISMLLFDG